MVLYHGEVRRRGKTQEYETRKSRREEKVVGFILAVLFPAKKWEAVTRVATKKR